MLFIFNGITRKLTDIQQDKKVCVKFNLIFLSLLQCYISFHFVKQTKCDWKKVQVTFLLFYHEREYLSVVNGGLGRLLVWDLDAKPDIDAWYLSPEIV